MADLSALGLTEEDLKPAKQESGALDLSKMGLTADDIAQPGAQPPPPPPESIPGMAAAAGDPLDLPTRAYTSQQDLELLNRNRPPDWSSPETAKGPFAEAFGQVVDMAAAFNRGVIGTVDLPVTLLNMGMRTMGFNQRAAGLSDIPGIGAATTGGMGPEGVVPGGLEMAAEFIGGGGAGQGLAQAGVKALGSTAAAATQGTHAQAAQRGLQELSKVELARDIKAAVGGGMASSAVNHSEILSDNMAAQILAPILGGAAGVAASAPKALAGRVKNTFPGGKRLAKTRAGEVLIAAADDPDEAVRELAKRNTIDISAVGQSGDVGVMTLARSLAKENPVFEGQLNDRFVLAQHAIKNEIDNLFTPDGRPVSPTAAQDFIKRNNQELIAMLDDRARTAMEAVQRSALLGRGQIDDINLSRQAKVHLEKSLRDVAAQRDALWSVVGKDIPVDIEPLKQEVTDIVQNAYKADIDSLPLKTMELILGRKINKSPTGLKIGNPISTGYGAQESVGELMALRSNLLAELRAETKDAISTKQAPIINRLQGAVVDIIDNADIPSGTDENAYRVAANFTRKMHETFDQGLIGRVLASNTKGGEAVLNEKTLSTLLAGGREAQAAGAREIGNVAMMQDQIGSVPLYKSKLLDTSQQYIASQFQRSVKTPEDAANFMLENEGAINRFPKLRQTLTEAMRAIGIQSGKLDAIKAGKAAIEKSAFSKIAGMNGKKAISTILSQRDPVKFAKQTRRLVANDRDALRGMQRDIADMVLDRSTTTMRTIPTLPEQVSKSALQRITKQLQPVIDAFYSSEMKGNLKLIQDEVGKLEALQSRTPRPVKIDRNMVQDLIARTSGAHLGARLASGGGAGTSLIAARAGSEAGRQLMFAIPERATKAILEEAMLDRQLLTKLLQRGVQSGKQSTELASSIRSVLLQNVGAQAADEFDKNVEALELNE